MGEKNNLCDLTPPHDFKDDNQGLQMTFPQGAATAKGFWILFYLHTEQGLGQQHHPIQIPLDNTSLTGSASNLTKPSCSDRKVIWNTQMIQDLLWKSATFSKFGNY